MTDQRHWTHIGRVEDLNTGAIEFALTADTAAAGTSPQRGFALRHDGEMRAYVNQCPHLGIELNWMPGRFMDSDGCFIQCATHGALFLPKSGECIAGPCQGDALTPLEVVERPDGIYIRPPE